jgi:hypothetical protein
MSPIDRRGEYDRYLQGLPVNDSVRELAREQLESNRAEEHFFRQQDPPARDDPRRALTDDEKEDLRRLTLEPGFAVLKRLETRILRLFEDAAILQSKSDPLADPQALATAWANVNHFSKIITIRDGAIADAIRPKQDPRDDAELLEREEAER